MRKRTKDIHVPLQLKWERRVISLWSINTISLARYSLIVGKLSETNLWKSLLIEQTSRTLASPAASVSNFIFSPNKLRAAWNSWNLQQLTFFCTNLWYSNNCSLSCSVWVSCGSSHKQRGQIWKKFHELGSQFS